MLEGRRVLLRAKGSPLAVRVAKPGTKPSELGTQRCGCELGLSGRSKGSEPFRSLERWGARRRDERPLFRPRSKRHCPSDCLRLTCKGNLQQVTREGLPYRHSSEVARSCCEPGDANTLRHMDEQGVVLSRNALVRSAKLVGGRVPVKAEHGERTTYVARDPSELGPLQCGSDGQHARVVRFDFHAHPTDKHAEKLLLPEIEHEVWGVCRQSQLLTER